VGVGPGPFIGQGPGLALNKDSLQGHLLRLLEEIAPMGFVIQQDVEVIGNLAA